MAQKLLRLNTHIPWPLSSMSSYRRNRNARLCDQKTGSSVWTEVSFIIAAPWTLSKHPTMNEKSVVVDPYSRMLYNTYESQKHFEKNESRHWKGHTLILFLEVQKQIAALDIVLRSQRLPLERGRDWGCGGFCRPSKPLSFFALPGWSLHKCLHSGESQDVCTFLMKVLS